MNLNHSARNDCRRRAIRFRTMNNNSIWLFFVSLLVVIANSSYVVNGDMIFEMRLIEFSNPLNRTYSNKFCGGGGQITAANKFDRSLQKPCQVGFLFCLVDLPFRNPQNCSLGDYTTSVMGSTNRILFTPNRANNFTYTFLIKKLPMVKKQTFCPHTFISIIRFLITSFFLLLYTARNWHDDRGERLRDE